MAGKARLKILGAKIAQIEGRMRAILTASQNITPETRSLFLTQADSILEMRNQYTELATELEEVRLEVDENYSPNLAKVTEFLNMADAAQSVLNQINREDRISIRTSANDSNRSEPAICRVKLEPIKMMNFDGSFEDWIPFIQSFTDLIDKNDSLSDLQKVNYLVSHLVGSAKSIVAGVPPTEENYPILLETLKARFEDNRALGHHYLDKLLNFKPISQESEKGLNVFLEGFVGAAAMIKKLKIDDLFDFFLLHIAGKKLDSETLRHFDMEFRNEEVPKFESLVTFVQAQVKILARSKKSLSLPVSSNNNSSRSPGINRGSNALVAQQTSSPVQCWFCRKSACQTLHQCQEFLKSSPKQRYEFVKRTRCCYRCLSDSHFSRNCKSPLNCSQCDRNHDSLLHFDSNDSPSTAPVPPSSNVASMSAVNVELSLTSSSPKTTHNSLVLLATAQVKVFDSRGKATILRALLDGGSQSHFVTKACCERLGLTTRPWRSFVKCLGRGTAPIREQVSFTFHSMVRPGVKYAIEALVMEELTENMPVVPVCSEYLSHITSLELADTTFDRPGPIDLLIGAALWPIIVGTGRVGGQTQMPFALESTLGWLVMGPAPVSMFSRTPSAFLASIVDARPLNELLEKFWSIEELPNVPESDPDESKCEQHFLENVRRNSEGRIEVSLPFRMSPSLLGESVGLATKRLLALERRLIRSPELHQKYCDIMRSYLELGYMSLVPSKELNQERESYFIPHHGVVKVGSTSTPLRIVLDASAPTSTNISLNDVLYIGPKLQKSLVEILLHFRLYRVALSSDIKQMYLRILMKPDDRRFQRLLWRFSPQDHIQMYQMNTVVFGVASSPYLALRSVQYLIENEKSRYPLAAQSAASCIYMDDYLSSVPTEQDACLLQRELQMMFAAGSFELAKWCSNSREVMLQIPEASRSVEALSFDEGQFLKILGLKWNPLDDTFSVKVSAPRAACTKRNMLSAIARIFDPLGFLAPLITVAKSLIRKLWALDLDWDQRPPETICQEWERFVSELPALARWSIPRHSFIVPGDYTVVLGFSDASQLAYGAVVYAVSRSTLGKSRISLLCAKSKIAPAQTVSIPRLELCAALLLSKLLRLVLDTYKLRHEVDKIYAFTDSTVTLQWISASPSRWKVFVANRVTQIQNNVDPENWFHVKGETNPADCLSRGVTARGLVEHSLWFQGPPWLLREESSWPITPVRDLGVPAQALEERVVALAALVPAEWILTPLLSRVSSFRKLIRTTAYVLRALRLTRYRTGILRATELEQAEILWYRRVQMEHFPDIVAYLRVSNDGNPKEKACDPLVGRLDLFLHDGVIRVGGRLNNSDLSYEQRHPILLPKKCKLVEMLVDQYHVDNLHTGAHLLLSLLHLKYWILAARDLVRKRVHLCNVCFRARPRPLQPKMAPLPSVRFQQCKAFVNTGVDYAGPLFVSMARQRGNRPLKAYLCLFICLSTKAVHLELASNLSTECFLAAFHRFLSRRGPCRVICSDQGTNFIGAKNSLSEFYKLASSTTFNRSVGKELSDRGIEWRLNPPAAPHFGGIWERSVQSVKTHLTKLVGNALLTYEELNTALVQIEALLNSRPLCSISSDPNDPTALTPAHFLTMGPTLDHLPAEDLTSVPSNRLDHYQRVTMIVQGFWRRWQTEYLHTLQERAKWTKESPPIAVGTVVVLMKENTPPLDWPLGVVEGIFAGRDGISRVAKLRTPRATLIRPLVKLCPLPSQ